MKENQLLRILEKGMTAWNSWRDEHNEITPSFGYKNFQGKDFTGYNFSNSVFTSCSFREAKLNNASFKKSKITDSSFVLADLKRSNFEGADLRALYMDGWSFNESCNFRGAKLQNANLKRLIAPACRFEAAVLKNADLKEADLRSVDFSFAKLQNADLSKSNLRSADLTGVAFRNTKLDYSKCNRTIFGSIDSSDIVGLDSIEHSGPSYLSIHSLALSRGQLPTSFLQGCGLKEWEIEFSKIYYPGISADELTDVQYRIFDMRISKPFLFYSCFISYSTKDKKFTKSLYDRLQKLGVRCWYDEKDAIPGKHIRSEIQKQIKIHDKLIVVISKNSYKSRWVEEEVQRAEEKERNNNSRVIIPICIDDVSKVEFGWIPSLRNDRFIGDFTRWQNSEIFEKSFKKLISAIGEKTINK